MAIIKQSDIISDLHYALTELQCNKCGSSLKWRTNFSDVNQPRYLSSHCNQDFIMSIASVRIKAQESDKIKNDRAKPRAIEVTHALSNKRRLGKERQATYKHLGKSVATRSHETETTSTGSLVSQDLKYNPNDPNNKDNVQTKHRTRELVLPSDSNVVKGNV